MSNRKITTRQLETALEKESKQLREEVAEATTGRAGG